MIFNYRQILSEKFEKPATRKYFICPYDDDVDQTTFCLLLGSDDTNFVSKISIRYDTDFY